ncbi:MAG: metallophosphoesterase [Planctomycetia bacterium]|nr:metallophosphoesterase [Planctomycetia bacterium]
MRICAVSDLHGHLPDVPRCDLLLIGGDICPTADHDPLYQASWLDTNFRAWLDQIPARHIVGVCGNHDFIFEQLPEAVPIALRWTYLQDSGCEIEKYKVWGTPWQPWFFNWAFNLEEEDLETRWAMIPKDTDILVLHGPPRGYGDQVQRGSHIENTGSPSLTERIKRIQPKLAIFGHIHEGRGEYRLGKTILANVSILDEEYRPIHPVWTCELGGDSRGTSEPEA